MNRREALKVGGLVAGVTLAKVAAQNSSAAEQPSRRRRIVITGGHPGDH